MSASHKPPRRGGQLASQDRIPSPFLLRARVVLPVAQPPVPDGAVLVSGRRVVEVGRWRDLEARASRHVVDLGQVVLLPGLVNAHSHLDYTGMAGQIPPPKVFSDWLKMITELKAGWERSDYLESWLKGAGMLVRSGTTTVADIEAMPQLLPEVWNATPLRVFSLLELIGMKGRSRPQDIVGEAVTRLRGLKHLRCCGGLSPHAPYTTAPELMRLSAQTARRRGWVLATHVAESALEYEMFARGSGSMFEWLRRSGRDMSDCGLGSPVQHLERCGALSPGLLAVHANYLGRRDASLLARSGAHVVHCPRCHFYFGHDPFPLRGLLKAGVNVCLGTDSLASIYKSRRQQVELNLFEEMRALANNAPWLSARKILAMATLNGARALGQSGRIGELTAGAFADLIALPFSGKVADVYEGVLGHTGDAAASMVDGQWAVAPWGLNLESERRGIRPR